MSCRDREIVEGTGLAPTASGRNGMDQSNTTSRPPTAWTWILGTILIIAILWVVFAMVARKAGSHNETLPKAQIRRGSMVAAVMSP